MTPKPESETDPWADVHGEMLEAYDGWFRCYRAVAVDAARAAEAAQHQGSASLGPVVVKWKEGRPTMRDTDWMVSWDGDYLASEPYGWMPIPAPLKVEREP